MKHCILLVMASVALLAGLASGNDNEENIETILMDPMDVLAAILKFDVGFEYAKSWECDGLKFYAEPINGGDDATSFKQMFGAEPGAVFHDGEQINTIYVREGLKRSWQWGLGEVEGHPTGYRYVIELEDGMARYYDFKGTGIDESITPRSLYFCK